MKLSRRNFIKGSAVAASAFALGACSSKSESIGSADSSQSAASDSEKTKLTVVLDYTPNTNHTGLYVAKNKGYFNDEGLDVEIVQPSEDGADALVGAGKAQIGVSYQDFMASYLGSDSPLPVTVVAALLQHNMSGIMSRKDDGITDPKHMSGKRYGTLDNDCEKAIIKYIVDENGGDSVTVVFVPANSTDEVSGLKADEFDDIWTFEGWGLENAHLQNYDVNYFSIKSCADVLDYYTPVLIANNDFISQSPDVLKAFLRACAKGYKYAVDNVEDAASILISEVPEADAALCKSSQKILSPNYISDAPKWGYIDKDRWSAFYNWMNEQKLTSVQLDISGGFTNDYLPE